MTAVAEAPRREAGVPPKERFKRQWDKRLSFIALHSVGIAMGVIFMLPILFVFLTAVMASDQAMTSSLWPSEWHFENFVKVFQKAPLLEYFGNSLLFWRTFSEVGTYSRFIAVASCPVFCSSDVIAS